MFNIPTSEIALKCRSCRKEKAEAEFFHQALCTNQDCLRSQNKNAPFYCDFCWNKKEFYPNCWECKSLKIKSGTL